MKISPLELDCFQNEETIVYQFVLYDVNEVQC